MQNPFCPKIKRVPCKPLPQIRHHHRPPAHCRRQPPRAPPLLPSLISHPTARRPRSATSPYAPPPLPHPWRPLLHRPQLRLLKRLTSAPNFPTAAAQDLNHHSFFLLQLSSSICQPLVHLQILDLLFFLHPYWHWTSTRLTTMARCSHELNSKHHVGEFNGCGR